LQGRIYRGTSEIEATGANLKGIWGASATDIVAVGEGQRYFEFDGSEWTPTAGDPFLAFNDVFGVGNAVIVVGGGGEVRRRIGSAWTTLPRPGDAMDELLGGWGTGPDDFYVVGVNGAAGILYRYTGSWAPEDFPPTIKINAIWGAVDGTTYAVGDGGALMTKGPGAANWTRTTLPATRLLDIAGSGVDGFAVGADGSLWRISPPSL
jgi:hypothetical protein